MTSPPTAATGIAVALIAAIAAVAKKILSRTPKPKPDPVTRTEFHHELTAVRDRIGAGYLALADKLEHQHTQLLSALDHHSENFERRLDSLDSAVARLDERTLHASISAH